MPCSARSTRRRMSNETGAVAIATASIGWRGKQGAMNHARVRSPTATTTATACVAMTGCDGAPSPDLHPVSASEVHAAC